jgi:hypothetical protein
MPAIWMNSRLEILLFAMFSLLLLLGLHHQSTLRLVVAAQVIVLAPLCPLLVSDVLLFVPAVGW